MTRMWSLRPSLMCDQHLLGEHAECHMLAENVRSGKSLDGYLRQHIVNPHRIGERHDELEAAMRDRGMAPDSPLDQPDASAYPPTYVDLFAAHDDLVRRCPDCAHRMATDASAQVVLG